jgi:small subunit ribosomal protein S21
MIRVQPKDGEPLDKTLRRLRKICNNEGVTKAMKRHSYFEKPSVRRRRRDRERLKTIRLATKLQST